MLSIFQDEKDSIDDKKFEYKTEKELNTFGTIVTISQSELEKYSAHCPSASPMGQFNPYTAISKKVVGKNVHTTISKGNMGYDQYTVP